MHRLSFVTIIFTLLFSGLTHAQSFRVNDIRVEGLQRVSAGSVFASLPIQIGDEVTPYSIKTATRALFKVGYFADIEMGRDGNVLVITVKERPAINEITIEGNKAIKTEQLLKALNDNGLSEGQIFKRVTLDGVGNSLERQYVAQGRYNATVNTIVEELPRNQVKLNIEIDEGTMAGIKHINIVGNDSFETGELLDLFELRTTGWLSWLNGNDRYSREKLTGDIERLESWYLDRGYLTFNLDSAQVSISPDKETVYITANITEGDIFTVSEVELAGDPVIDEALIERLILLREGQTFSQALMTRTQEYITKRLGNEGYTFAKVEGIPERNDEDKTVKVTFFIDPGKRAYVNRINFRGNTKSVDEVLRREMRQMEGASANTSKIEFSKVRLERLGFFKTVTVDTVEVPGTSDLVDVDFEVEEQPSGSIGMQVGFAQGSGLVLGANVQQNNWLGTGKQVGFNVSTSKYQKSAQFNYNDPYFTVDGVSRGFSVFYTKRDFSEVNVSSYTTDTYGANLSFGYPMSETSRVGFTAGWRDLTITTGDFAVQEIVSSPTLYESIPEQYVSLSEYDSAISSDYPLTTAPLENSMLSDNPAGFINENGDEFSGFMVSLSWSESTLNRGVLATRGRSQRVSTEISLPGTGLEYYKLQYNAQYFQPLTKSLTLRLRTDLGYAGAYGNTTEVPFFEHFYAGGFGSVRGFERNSLGPRSTPPEAYQVVSSTASGTNDAYILCDTGTNCTPGKLLSSASYNDDDPFGGNVLVEGSAEILFPLPWIKDQSAFQAAFFVDAGNVFDSNCGKYQRNCSEIDLSLLSSSYGLGLTWISGFGPMTFSIAKPLKKNELDEVESFQFSMGNTF